MYTLCSVRTYMLGTHNRVVLSSTDRPTDRPSGALVIGACHLDERKTTPFRSFPMTHLRMHTVSDMLSPWKIYCLNVVGIFLYLAHYSAMPM